MKRIIIKIFLFFILLKSSPIFGQMYSLDDLSTLGDSHICENKVYQSIDDAILLGKIWDMKEGKLVNDRYVSNRVADINKDGIKEILMQR